MKKEKKKDDSNKEKHDFLKEWKELNPDPPVVKPDKVQEQKEKGKKFI